MSACSPQIPVVGKQQSCAGERDAIASWNRVSLPVPESARFQFSTCDKGTLFSELFMVFQSHLSRFNRA